MQHRYTFALAIAFIAGLGIGQLGSPERAHMPDASRALAVAPNQRALPLQTGPLLPAADCSAAAETSYNALADAWLNDPRTFFQRHGFDLRGGLQPALDFVIHQMSDDELASAISGVTNLTESDVSSVRDLRKFASRLLAVAADRGTPEPEADTNEVEPVKFSTRVSSTNIAEEPAETFEIADGRIYAVFASERYRQDNVLVKWHRRDKGKVLAFKKLPIEINDSHSFAWFEPNEFWKPGEYAVEFYTTDDRVAPIAAGSFTVR